ncbi:MAG TPA: cation ABC transporter substrate-binding protein [Desulfobacteraceae bacterium]|nr:cation ABC transporter substrate-binding protein [Desulfobacteraceae bacterium]
MKKRLKIFLLVINIVLLSGRFALATAWAGNSLKVFVSIIPQKYFVEKIGGDLADVSVMVLPGASPATYEPKPRQMVALSKARIYFAIGVPFEKAWLKKIKAANPRMLVVHTEAGIEKKSMKPNKPQGIKDPHIWLSPPLVIVQARNILSAMLKIDPASASIYEANYKKFIMEVVDLDAELRGIFLEKERARFMVFHPAWGYFARTYGLKMVPVESEGKNPKPAGLKRLIEKAKKQDIKVVFVQPEFSTKSAEIIAKAIGGQVAFASPLAPDWAINLKEVALNFKAALR